MSANPPCSVAAASAGGLARISAAETMTGAIGGSPHISWAAAVPAEAMSNATANCSLTENTPSDQCIDRRMKAHWIGRNKDDGSNCAGRDGINEGCWAV